MYYVTDIKHFVSIFSLIFNPIDPFFIDLKSFVPFIFIKSYICIIFHVLNSATQNLMKYPSPTGSAPPCGRSGADPGG